MTQKSSKISALLQTILDELLSEFTLTAADRLSVRELILSQAENDPYLQSKLERILDLSPSS